MNINLTNDKLFNTGGSIEPAVTVGTGEAYADIESVPSALKYPGKHIYNKDSNTKYVIDSDGNPQLVPSIQGVTSLVVLTQAEYDELTPDEDVLYFII
jgi:hypothetical protein